MPLSRTSLSRTSLNRTSVNAVGGFNEVVAFASGMQTAENVGEVEAGVELLGFDQETRTVGDPWIG
jgi:catabolite regulation protein CreA